MNDQMFLWCAALVLCEDTVTITVCKCQCLCVNGYFRQYGCVQVIGAPCIIFDFRSSLSSGQLHLHSALSVHCCPHIVALDPQITLPVRSTLRVKIPAAIQ
ncbi:hypothetical protein BXZ70DRAFT_478805 [Cristinia sonorae]|uniref:Secreted protein n=1 Tax=Cristinia sonorae TaxID=1940300 RepID=A0A8K0XLT0_9AGAR|nr:hypothetical protein BXZ70DRAFT_478805 [Cristinia sonorae]